MSHVPTYTGCTENCCKPPRIHTTSQVIYLKGSGGLEIHLESETSPINIKNSEILDVDAVFRDEIDQSTYDLYIGCGGCIASEDPIVINPLILNGYQPAEIEPFTQTSYRSIFPKENRKFNSSLLSNHLCTEKHFTIRLVDYMNRTNGKEIIWAPVIGLGEKFTFLELLEFPIYILRNHGNTWNELGWTYWLWLFIGTPLLINLIRYILTKCNYSVFTPFKKKVEAREILYEIAIIGFTAASLELLTHLIYVQIGVEVNYGLYVGLFGVILFSQGIPILFTYTVWLGIHRRADKWIISSPYWAPLEIATGFSFLFLFGSGFYIGPAAIMLAGILRCREICYEEKNIPAPIEIEVDRKIIHNSKSKNLGFIN